MTKKLRHSPSLRAMVQAIRETLSCGLAGAAGGVALVGALAPGSAAGSDTDPVSKGQQTGSDFVVNTLSDEFDNECGVDPGTCSLADAIGAANRSGTPSTITFDETALSGNTVTFSNGLGGNALPPVVSELTIMGFAGLVLQRDPALGCSLNGQTEPGEFRLLETSSGKLSLSDMTLRNGCADVGQGGALLLAGDLNLDRVTLQGNTASTGGAVAGRNASLSISGSTINGNTAADAGGGIYGVGSDVVISDSTISGNTADNMGGALMLLGDFSGNGHRLLDSTLADNTAVEGAAVYLGDTPLTVQRSLIAGSAPDQCEIGSGSTLTPLDVLATDASCNTALASLTELALHPLTRFGDATPVHPLGAGSVAIDRASSLCPQTDQLGQPRPFDGDNNGVADCDLGAFEVQQLEQPGPGYQVNSQSGDFDGICGDDAGGCSLPDAVSAANRSAGPSTVSFDPSLLGVTISLQNALLIDPEIGPVALPSLLEPLTLDGGTGVTVTRAGGGDCMRFFASDGQDLNLSHVTLAGGCAEGADSATGDGAAIWIAGAQLLANTVTLVGNTADRSGGAISALSATVKMTGSTITGNTANMGGGIYSGQTDSYPGAPSALTISASTITGNTAFAGGGGLALVGNTVTMAGGGNAGSSRMPLPGGAAGAGSSSFTLTDSQLSGNTANLGGGVYLRGVTAQLTGSTIVANTADLGGGVYALATDDSGDPGSAITITGITLSGNTASSQGGGALFTGVTVSLLNASVISNTADAQGSGIHAVGEGSQLTITDSNIVGNTVTNLGSQLVVGVGLPSGAIDLSRNVFDLGGTAANVKGGPAGSNCQLGSGSADPGNFASDGSCGEATVVRSEQMNLLPGEGDGPPVPGPGSVLVDVYDGCSGLDQRNLPRGVNADGIAGQDCDVGAVEVQNVPVVAVADDDITSQNSAAAGNVLDNDTDPEDEDTGLLAVVSVDMDANGVGETISLLDGGTVLIRQDGEYDFDPAGDFVGLDAGDVAQSQVFYAVSDGYAVDSTSLTVQVSGLNDPPQAVPVQAVTDQDSPISDSLDGSDPDNGETLQYRLVSQPTAGQALLLDPALGSFSFEPAGQFQDLDDDESRQVQWVYEVADEAANDTATVTVTVSGLNDAPTPQPDRYTVIQGQTINIPAGEGLLSNDSDPDDEMLVVTSTGQFTAEGVGGLLSLAADGSLSFEAPLNVGQASFSYSVSDGDAAASAELLLDVVTADSTDLSISKTDSRSVVAAGEMLTYTIIVSNAGPSDVTGAQVEDLLPPELLPGPWTCSVQGSAQCSPSGSGSIQEQVDISAGSSVTFELMATVADASLASTLVNTATVTAPPANPEVNPDNNQASDSNLTSLLFRNGFETSVINKRFSQRRAGVGPKQVLNRIATARRPHAPVLLLRAHSTGQPALKLALIHARRAPEGLQYRVSRFENGYWATGQWQPLVADSAGGFLVELVTISRPLLRALPAGQSITARGILLPAVADERDSW